MMFVLVFEMFKFSFCPSVCFFSKIGYFDKGFELENKKCRIYTCTLIKAMRLVHIVFTR